MTTTPNLLIEHIASNQSQKEITASEVKTKVDAVDTRLSNLDRMANQWKGGFAVILSLGAVAGVLIDQLVRFLFSR